MVGLVYIGVAVNIIGALVLLIYAIRYFHAFRQAERLTVKMDALKAQWRRKRLTGFGLMIGGLILAIIGCYL